MPLTIASHHFILRDAHDTIFGYVLAGKAINSCDISPCKQRLATAGGDGCVRIWHLPAVASHSEEHASALPKRLATLSDHTEADVNVVRFSPDGELLATAGDDQTIILYKKHAGRGDTVFGSRNEGGNHENWRAAHVCRRAVMTFPSH